MAVDIYIREKSGSREIRIPILPEEIPIESGATTFASSEIMQRGEVAVPTGTELSTYPWESEFPGALRKNDPLIRGTWQDPKTYHTILEDWKTNGTKLNLLVIGYPYINKDVYLKEYEPTLSGAFGDIAYKIAFIEARDITIKTTKIATTKRPSSGSSSYTIKSGDTLWGISYKFYGTGTKWKVIYDANKDIIEKTAKARWKAAGINRDSQNGHWIFPGVTITIPGVGGGSGSSSGSSSGGSSGSTKDESTNLTKAINAAQKALDQVEGVVAKLGSTELSDELSLALSAFERVKVVVDHRMSPNIAIDNTISGLGSLLKTAGKLNKSAALSTPISTAVSKLKTLKTAAANIQGTSI